MTQINEHELYKQLFTQYGVIVGGIELAKLLGYSNTAALRQARKRDNLACKLFKIENRRGYFAYIKDIAHWLAQLNTVEQQSNLRITKKHGGQIM